MENNSVSKYTVSFGISLALVSVINGLLVLAKEMIPSVMSAMKSLTGHHWVTHSVISVSLFLLLGWVFARGNGGQGVKLTGKQLINILVSGVALGGLLIVGFYLIGG